MRDVDALRAYREIGFEGVMRPDHVPTLAGGETILLVEDEPMLRRLVRRGLEDGGFVVLEAEDAERALAVAEQFEGRIDLLLTDLVDRKEHTLNSSHRT